MASAAVVSSSAVVEGVSSSVVDDVVLGVFEEEHVAEVGAEKWSLSSV